MKEFIISQAQAETAVLVAIVTSRQDERKTAEYLDELEFLAETAGVRTVKRFTQRAEGPNTTTYVGSGKLAEIRAYIEAEAEAERDARQQRSRRQKRRPPPLPALHGDGLLAR